MRGNRKNTIYLTLRFFFLSPQQRGVVRSITVPPLFACFAIDIDMAVTAIHKINSCSSISSCLPIAEESDASLLQQDWTESRN